MKKLLFASLIVAASTGLTSCLTMMPAAGTEPATQPQQTQPQQTQDPLNGILGGITTAADAQTGLGGVLGNILSSVLGSATTTQANLIGTWTYYEPSVQFESENLLTQAGGAAAATKVETKLVDWYKKIGITPGKMVFSFTRDNKVTCNIGSRVIEGTYVFDNANKVVNITTASGLTLKAYVTISGNQMSLCFDSTKLLALLSSFGGAQGTLGSLGTLAQSFSGMKTGFKFKR